MSWEGLLEGASILLLVVNSRAFWITASGRMQMPVLIYLLACGLRS